MRRDSRRRINPGFLCNPALLAYIWVGRDPSNTSRDSKSFLLSNTNQTRRRVLRNSRGPNLSNPSCCLHRRVLDLGEFPWPSFYLRVSLGTHDCKTMTWLYRGELCRQPVGNRSGKGLGEGQVGGHCCCCCCNGVEGWGWWAEVHKLKGV